MLDERGSKRDFCGCGGKEKRGLSPIIHSESEALPKSYCGIIYGVSDWMYFYSAAYEGL